MTALGAIVAICAGVVSIATGINTLWNKITESKAKRQLAERTALDLTQKKVALVTCQRIQAWQWAALCFCVIALVIVVSRSSALRGA